MIELLLGAVIATTPVDPSQIIIDKINTSQIVLPAPIPELTLEQKIEQNVNNCNTDTDYIWASDATCHPKPTYTAPVVKTSLEPIKKTARTNVGSTTGNTYSRGNCVWHVKNKLGWVQNGWSNANLWTSRSGHAISNMPIVGSVASARNYSHVAIVLEVRGTSVYLEEMNYKGFGIVSYRIAPISEFQYIYP